MCLAVRCQWTKKFRVTCAAEVAEMLARWRRHFSVLFRLLHTADRVFTRLHFGMFYCLLKPPLCRSGEAWGFQEVEAPKLEDCRHMKVVSLSALRIGCLYPQEILLLLIYVRGWFYLRAIVRPEGLCQWKMQTPPTESEPVTSRLVVRFLNQLHHCALCCLFRYSNFSDDRTPVTHCLSYCVISKEMAENYWRGNYFE